MSVNRFLPHLIVLPEDDADRQLANGFFLNLYSRQVQILPEAGGWMKLCETFRDEHAPTMSRYRSGYFVLLLDFDNDPERFAAVRRYIPDELADRVFVLGARTEPEDLKREMRLSFEGIGKALSEDCREDVRHRWSLPLLEHNGEELARMRASVCSLLFPE